MNTSVLYEDIGLRESLPEVHAEYTFRNSSNGYNYTYGSYNSHVYYNSTNGTDGTNLITNGAMILLVEEFKRGNFYEIGAGYINRIWTIRVPETTTIPYYLDHFDHPERTEIVSVPIVIKAYTCEMKRVKKSEY